MNRWFLDLFWTVGNRYWNRITILPKKKKKKYAIANTNLCSWGLTAPGGGN